MRFSGIEPYYFSVNFDQILGLLKSIAGEDSDTVVPALGLMWLCISNINAIGQDLLD